MELERNLIYELDAEIEERKRIEVTGFSSPAAGYSRRRINLNNELIKNSNTYVFRTAGDSMIRAGIHPNAYIVFEKKLKYHSGQIVVVRIDDEYYVRRYVEEPTGYFLRPENPNYPATLISNALDYKIHGVVNYSINSHR